ncbi:SIS domain-containing protein [Aestuariispira insulae]|uniref:Glutamine--fructose-6-phosphate transaminase n=1 Tax=Aestuariispira insulae TaxID=1461337 RepID=A0A3D9HQ39_9PROT|nr:SIS domain-containing protein [Aestuariispira insulae]RED51592.1 glutamine--fructose-6-phosphate transaminase [Aestuariispira insulae]
MTALPEIRNDAMTLMESEAREAPDVVARQLAANEDACTRLADHFKDRPLRMIATCARGSSDHAAAYAKYLMETELGLPVISSAPSMGSIYNRPMNLQDTLFIVISQSGKSPDLVANAAWAKRNGAFILALVNVEGSPVTEIADMVIPLHAGAENSVAATKSYIASLTAILQVTAYLSGSDTLINAAKALPDQLRQAVDLNWSKAVVPLAASDDLLVIGRGLGFGIAQEAALKFKETSALHAEAFSAAEVMHGPLALVQDRYPLLVFSQQDETRDGVKELVTNLRSKGARAFVAETEGKSDWHLPIVPDMPAATAPIAMIQSFYLLVNAIALARGYDPDRPANLQKVTETL